MATTDRPTAIVLVTGAAPYLGGSQTWLPLRRAMPEVEFRELDALRVADARDGRAAMREAIEALLDGAAAIVAHATATGPAVEAVANVDPGIATVLLAPQHLTRERPVAGAVRALLSRRFFCRLLTTFAQSKLAKLRHDENYVRKQLRLMVSDEALTESLLLEARVRIADPSTAQAVQRTADFLRAALEPIDAGADAMVRRRIVLGKGSLSATMIDSVDEVARALRKLLEG
ncbi:MAG TPA: hypothetical protein VNG31_00830 [Candidatus Baltobacteraceae bacterium]|nr:hypothetical protein [Candidatus Baltobacteraceae bacterium]